MWKLKNSDKIYEWKMTDYLDTIWSEIIEELRQKKGTIRMRLLIVRHGDPDYSIDSLTEKGWKEAEYLSERLSKLDVKDFYVSPLGRAKDTASFTLKKMNRTAVECDWLREFENEEYDEVMSTKTSTFAAVFYKLK